MFLIGILFCDLLLSNSLFSLRNGYRNGVPEIIDPGEEVRSLERKVDGEMSSSELVVQGKLMGFDERMIKTALKRL